MKKATALKRLVRTNWRMKKQGFVLRTLENTLREIVVKSGRPTIKRDARRGCGIFKFDGTCLMMIDAISVSGLFSV